MDTSVVSEGKSVSEDNEYNHDQQSDDGHSSDQSSSRGSSPSFVSQFAAALQSVTDDLDFIASPKRSSNIAPQAQQEAPPPNNEHTFVRRMTESLTAALSVVSNSPECDWCEEYPSLEHCPLCDQCLCSKCARLHARGRITQTHQTFPYASHQSKLTALEEALGGSDSDKSACAHFSVQQDTGCFCVNCRMFLCTECTAQATPSHTIVHQCESVKDLRDRQIQHRQALQAWATSSVSQWDAATLAQESLAVGRQYDSQLSNQLSLLTRSFHQLVWLMCD